MNDQAIDNQLHDARKRMLDLFADDHELTLDEVSTLLRLAYGKGYVDASRQPDRETAKRLAVALGVINPDTGEMC